MILDSSQIGTNKANKAKTDLIAEKMGLESMPDVYQLILDCNNEMYMGNKLLKHLDKPNDKIPESEEPEYEVSDFDLINKVAKSKQSKKIKPIQW
jgi:hypothetical protein